MPFNIDLNSKILIYSAEIQKLNKNIDRLQGLIANKVPSTPTLKNQIIELKEQLEAKHKKVKRVLSEISPFGVIEHAKALLLRMHKDENYEGLFKLLKALTPEAQERLQRDESLLLNNLAFKFLLKNPTGHPNFSLLWQMIKPEQKEPFLHRTISDKTPLISFICDKGNAATIHTLMNGLSQEMRDRVIGAGYLGLYQADICSVIDRACKSGNVMTVQALLSHLSQDQRAPLILHARHKKRNVLQRACYRGDTEIIRVLLGSLNDNGKKSVTEALEEKSGENVLHLACSSGKAQAVAAVLNALNDEQKRALASQKSIYDCLPFDRLSAYSQNGVIFEHLDSPLLIELIENKGGHKGFLSYFLGGAHTSTIRRVIGSEGGRLLLMRDDQNRTLLDYAIRFGNLETIQLLLEKFDKLPAEDRADLWERAKTLPDHLSDREKLQIALLILERGGKLSENSMKKTLQFTQYNPRSISEIKEAGLWDQLSELTKELNPSNVEVYCHLLNEKEDQAWLNFLSTLSSEEIVKLPWFAEQYEIDLHGMWKRLSEDQIISLVTKFPSLFSLYKGRKNLFKGIIESNMNAKPSRVKLLKLWNAMDKDTRDGLLNGLLLEHFFDSLDIVTLDAWLGLFSPGKINQSIMDSTIWRIMLDPSEKRFALLKKYMAQADLNHRILESVSQTVKFKSFCLNANQLALKELINVDRELFNTTEVQTLLLSNLNLSNALSEIFDTLQVNLNISLLEGVLFESTEEVYSAVVSRFPNEQIKVVYEEKGLDALKKACESVNVSLIKKLIEGLDVYQIPYKETFKPWLSLDKQGLSVQDALYLMNLGAPITRTFLSSLKQDQEIELIQELELQESKLAQVVKVALLLKRGHEESGKALLKKLNPEELLEALKFDLIPADKVLRECQETIQNLSDESLSVEQKRALLPLFSPERIEELARDLSDDDDEILDTSVGEGTSKNLLGRIGDEMLMHVNDKNRESYTAVFGDYLGKVSYKTLAALAQGSLREVLFKLIPFMQPLQLKSIIPFLSPEEFDRLMKEDFADQSLYLSYATTRQKVHFFHFYRPQQDDWGKDVEKAFIAVCGLKQRLMEWAKFRKAALLNMEGESAALIAHELEGVEEFFNSRIKEAEAFIAENEVVDETPDEFLDPVMQTLMENPMKGACGHIYDESTFSDLNNCCALCRGDLEPATPALELKGKIDAYLAKTN